MGFIAGRMTAKYGGTDIGQVVDGFVVEHTPRKRLIQGDSFRAPQDAVFRGHDVFIEFEIMEYANAALQSMIWPHNATYGDAGPVGDLDSSLWGAGTVLLLEDIAGGSAANTPNSLTANRAVLADGFPIELLMAPDLRTIPIRMRLYPSGTGPSTDDTAFFTIT